MKIYYANRCSLGGTVGVREEDGTRTLEHIVRHSPDGFEWGYGGSGPSDLALSILVDYFGGWPDGSRQATKNYQQFKWDFIASAPREGFEISADEIETWMEGQK